MTFEELKAEADKQGYRLVKKYEKVQKLKKCPKCNRYPKVTGLPNAVQIVCPTEGCLEGTLIQLRNSDGVKLKISRTNAELKARIEWNELVGSYSQ